MANGPLKFVAGVGGLGPQRIGGGKSIPWAISRYFRRNEGTTDYISIPAVTLPSDFIISWKSQDLGGGAGNQVVLNAPGVTNNSFIYYADGSRQVFVRINKTAGGAGFLGLDNITPDFTDFTLVKVGNSYTLSGAGQEKALIVTGAKPFVISAINNGLEGVVSDVVFNDSGALTRNYPINDNSNTIRDLVSGQDGTVINGNVNDWGLFKEQPTLWDGQDLTVPPWDSVDQELIKA